MKATVNAGVMTLEVDDPFIVEEVMERIEIRIQEAVDKYQYEFALKYIQDFLVLNKAYEKMKDSI